ncbi:hypothetical protein WA158_002107 [Blastocystis sp. Blastoise]
MFTRFRPALRNKVLLQSTTKLINYRTFATTSVELRQSIQKIYDETLIPISEKCMGPVDRRANQIPALPMVLLLGNHSSGKSTFINYYTGRPIQHTGVAPTDDSFTLIVPGNEDSDKDGRTLTGDPDFGFSSLTEFGPKFLGHVSLKVRKDLKNKEIMLIDSPGMIDNPAVTSDHSNKDRGYNFMGVTRWFAERCDLILFFFDPDKPGTTGETLNALVTALNGLDYKLCILLNKVDLFTKVHDFGRSYGSLAWNLAKIIPRKDMPLIYTMCVPHGDKDKEELNSAVPLVDLRGTRDEVITKLNELPVKRMDNMISRLLEVTNQIDMHCNILNYISAKQQSLRWKILLAPSLVSILGLGSTFLLWENMGLVASTVGIMAGTSLVLPACWYFFSLTKGKRELRRLCTDSGIDSIYKILYRGEFTNDEYFDSIYSTVKLSIKKALSTYKNTKIPKIPSSDLKKLDFIINHDYPRLRRETSPERAGDDKIINSRLLE